MGSFILDPQEAQQIQDYLTSPEPLLQRLAQIVLLYAGGGSTQQVAHTVNLSRSRTRFWRRQFELNRMQIFQIRGRKPTSPIVAPIEVEELAQPESVDMVMIAEPDFENLITATNTSPFPSPLEKTGMLPDDPIAEAGRKVMLFQFAEMLHHESGTLAGVDIEALHEMRVATRRLRAAFDVFSFAFKPKAVKPHLKGLRTIGRALGRVRDLDVFIEKAGFYILTLPPSEQGGLDPLIESWHQERSRLRDELIANMNSPEYLKFKLSFNKFIQTPGAGLSKIDPNSPPIADQVRHVAPTIIYTRLATLRAYGALVPNASIPQLHALRIEFKRLRYTLEFFQEVLGKEVKQIISDIKKMQDHLGDLQDADVACIMLSQFLEQWDRRQFNQLLSERLNPQPIVTYLANRHAERHSLATSFPQRWAEFNNSDFFHSLAMSIAVL